MNVMRVKVKFFAALREITGIKEGDIEMQEGATVENLLTKLTQKFGPQFKNYVFDEKTGTFKGYLQLLMDGKNISQKEGLKTRLNDGAQFAIVPPVGGG